VTSFLYFVRVSRSLPWVPLRSFQAYSLPGGSINGLWAFPHYNDERESQELQTRQLSSGAAVAECVSMFRLTFVRHRGTLLSRRVAIKMKYVLSRCHITFMAVPYQSFLTLPIDWGKLLVAFVGNSQICHYVKSCMGGKNLRGGKQYVCMNVCNEIHELDKEIMKSFFSTSH
jgi:hypothetical protein